MNCPVCQVELRIAERQGVEIDYCPQCRGVWLDRGELDKIIDRSHALTEPSRRESPQGPSEYRQPPPRSHEPVHRHPMPAKHKRRNFLEEIFDFD